MIDKSQYLVIIVFATICLLLAGLIETAVFTIFSALFAIVLIFIPLLVNGPKLLLPRSNNNAHLDIIHYKAGWYSYLFLFSISILYYYATVDTGIDSPSWIIPIGMFSVISTYWELVWKLKKNRSS